MGGHALGAQTTSGEAGGPEQEWAEVALGRQHLCSTVKAVKAPLRRLEALLQGRDTITVLPTASPRRSMVFEKVALTSLQGWVGMRISWEVFTVVQRRSDGSLRRGKKSCMALRRNVCNRNCGNKN